MSALISHVVTRIPPVYLDTQAGLEVHCVPVWQDNLTWILRCTQTGEAAIIDAPEVDPVLRYIEARALNVRTIWNTHVHADHVGINRQLARRGLLEGWRVEGPARQAAKVPGLTRGLDEGDRVQLGALSGAVWLTEGHQDGHLSYLFGRALFCGDTLFAGGCGRLFDGPAAKMYASLMRFAALDPQTLVFCAHEYTEDNLRFALFVEPDNARLRARLDAVRAVRAQGGCTVPSTIEEERATNPYLRSDQPQLRARVAELLPGQPLDGPLEVFTALRLLKDQKRHLAP